MIMSVPKLTLSYFGFAGRAEPIRLAAAVGKVPFTNKVVSFGDLGKMPLKQVPILEIEQEGKEKVTLTQSVAMLRYFGKLGGLYPEDPVEAMKVDSMMDIIADASKIVEMTVMGAVKHYLAETDDWSAEEKIAIRKRFLATGLPKFMGPIEETLQSNSSGWLVGENVTIADLFLYRFASWIGSGMLDGIPTTTMDDSFPGIAANKAKVDSLPQVVQWKEDHPTPYGDFDFVPPS